MPDRSPRGRHFDVCVVGAGPTGLVFATVMAERGHTVAVLDAGRLGEGRWGAGNCAPGTRHNGIANGWASGLGGTSQKWGGQLGAWPQDDFDTTADESAGAWPLTPAELRRHYATVERLLGLRQGLLTDKADAADAASRVAVHFYAQDTVWLPPRRRNLGRTLGSRVAARDNVCLVDGALVDAITPATGGGPRVTRVAYRESGSAGSLTAATVVLAAGTLGNVELLRRLEGLDQRLVGTGFMDHASTRVARFRITEPDLFRRTVEPRFSRGLFTTPKLVAAPALRRDKDLRRCFAGWEVPSPGEAPDRSSAVRLCNRARMAVHALRHRRRYVDLTGGVAYLRVDCEQPSRPETRLGTRTDGALQLSWVVGEDERRTSTTLGEVLVEDLDLAGMGLAFASWEPPDYADTFHMMGGARMSASAADGVVDRDLRVHGLDDLYVLGACVFTSGGIANPTTLAMALAARLAEHLSGSSASPAA